MTAGEATAPSTGATSMATEPLVVCERVSRHFGTGAQEVAAISEVSVTVVPGMRVALTGPSGSGKSTLLHLMAGLERPSSGTVRWPGLDGLPNSPGIVGLIFQGPSLVPALDALENVTLPLLLAGTAEDDARARAMAALERLAVPDLAAKLPEELSGGQAQRVAVARVLASRPRLILADEPTGQLDHETGTRVVSVLLETAADVGAALVVTTHDPAVADRLSVQWHMRDGRIAGIDQPC